RLALRPSPALFRSEATRGAFVSCAWRMRSRRRTDLIPGDALTPGVGRMLSRSRSRVRRGMAGVRHSHPGVARVSGALESQRTSDRKAFEENTTERSRACFQV